MYVKIHSGQKLINNSACSFYCTLFYNVHYTKKRLGNCIYTIVLMQTMKTGDSDHYMIVLYLHKEQYMSKNHLISINLSL